MTTLDSIPADSQLPFDRLGNEFCPLFPIQRQPQALSRLAAIWLRELPIHWIAVQGREAAAGWLKASIEERQLEPGRIRQAGSPTPAISSQDWDAAVVWEFASPDSAQTLGAVRLDRQAAERPQAELLRTKTAGLFAQSARWDAELLAAKLESLAEFAAGAGHEINNPLGTITGRVQLLLMKETDPGRRQMLEIIGGQALRIRDMIGDVMLFARPPKPVCELISCQEWLPKILARFISLAERQGTKLVTDVAEGIALWGDPVQTGIAIGSLLQNSLNALGEGGEIQLTLQPSPLLDSSVPFVRITLEDDGPGLSPVEREHLFDPYFSGRQAGRGLGFGLPKTWRIVTQHGGTIQAIERHPRGLKMVIDWPTSPPPIASSSEDSQDHDPVV